MITRCVGRTRAHGGRRRGRGGRRQKRRRVVLVAELGEVPVEDGGDLRLEGCLVLDDGGKDGQEPNSLSMGCAVLVSL